MSNCQHCGAKATLYLCNSCSTDLRTKLVELPQWIDWLADTALKRTKLGDGSRRGPNDDAPLPFEPDTENSRQTKQGRASALLATVVTGLATIGLSICQRRGTNYRAAAVRIAHPKFIGPLRRHEIRANTPSDLQLGIEGLPAWWLAARVDLIAADPDAGTIYAEIARFATEIEAVINPPVPMRFCGPCPTIVSDPETGRLHDCSTRLMAKRDAVQVRCPKCKTEHNIDTIINRLLATVDHWRFTREELIGSRSGDWSGIMGLLEEPVSRRTFYRWRADGELKPNGYRRPSGVIGVSRRDERDEPLFRLSKVRELRRKMGEKQAAAMRWDGKVKA